MITYAQIHEMDAAWHDAANAFQRLGVAAQRARLLGRPREAVPANL